MILVCSRRHYDLLLWAVELNEALLAGDHRIVFETFHQFESRVRRMVVERDERVRIGLEYKGLRIGRGRVSGSDFCPSTWQ
jgi:hypothetical protein